MSARQGEMVLKLDRIERDIVVQKKIRAQRVRDGLAHADCDGEIEQAKKSIGRIRAHLKMGVYQ